MLLAVLARVNNSYSSPTRWAFRIAAAAQEAPIFTLGLRRLYLRMLGLSIGQKAMVAASVHIGSTKIVIGHNAGVNLGSFLDGCGRVIIEDEAQLGPFVKVLTGSHDIRSDEVRISRALVVRDVVFRRGCWVGMGAMILPGVTVGAGAVVCAGSVVHKDVAPNTMVGGNPARLIKRLPVADPDNVVPLHAAG